MRRLLGIRGRVSGSGLCLVAEFGINCGEYSACTVSDPFDTFVTA